MAKRNISNDKKTKKIAQIIDEHAEIKEALETMNRILIVENAKARNLVEQSERYFKIR